MGSSALNAYGYLNLFHFPGNRWPATAACARQAFAPAIAGGHNQPGGDLDLPNQWRDAVWGYVARTFLSRRWHCPASPDGSRSCAGVTYRLVLLRSQDHDACNATYVIQVVGEHHADQSARAHPNRQSILCPPDAVSNSVVSVVTDGSSTMAYPESPWNCYFDRYQYAWTVPANYPTGSSYKLRVTRTIVGCPPL